VAREAYPDVPGEEDAKLASFEEWLAMDMQGAGDRPEATFVAALTSATQRASSSSLISVTSGTPAA
jgi:hypothetical protein